jgi:hypothetical protein
MIFTNRKTSNSLNAKESEMIMNERKIVGQALATSKERAEQLAKLKPCAMIERWKEYYIVTFFEES